MRKRRIPVMSTRASRRRLRWAALVAVIAACSAVPAASGAGTGLRGRVYVASRGCQGRAYRPTSIVLACGDGGLYVTGLRYSAYGGASAQATGELHAHSCMPNCAESRFQAFAGTITLKDVVRCEGTLYYSRARYTFTSGPPFPGEPASGTAYIQPVNGVKAPKCSAVGG
jgi:hypothetical protein